MTKHEIKLTAKERQKLLAIVSKGRNQAVVIRRAHILLKSDEGKTDREICDQLYIGEETARRTRLRFCEDGLDNALSDKPGRGATAKLNESQEAHLTALACTEPPNGRTRWTLELLAQRMAEDGLIEHIAPETVRLILKKNRLSLGRSKVGVSPR
ncbi:MAG: helix-turn-helix domain-containing protein [Aggregatilineales bacterium]